MKENSPLEFFRPQDKAATVPPNMMAVQLIELLTQTSNRMESIMLNNGMPAEVATQDTSAFLRAGIGALKAKTDNATNQLDWRKSPLLAAAVNKIVDPLITAAVPELVTAFLCSDKLHSMPAVTVNGLLMTAADIRDFLRERDVIYRIDKEWKPTACFVDKGLFACSSFTIKSKWKPLKTVNTLKLTFKGKCYISVLLSNPDLDPMNAYMKTFMTEII
jgi:hypothetical protein